MFWVKYVRREISTLTDNDREEFLDAFHTLWEVNTVDGMAKYGERYKSIYWFAILHNDGSGNSVCDEFHGDVGFLPNNVYLLNYLEQSLQLVNPKVTLPYVEYSKYFGTEIFSEHLALQLSGGGWTELLTATYFGRNDPYTGRIIGNQSTHPTLPYPTLSRHPLNDVLHTLSPHPSLPLSPLPLLLLLLPLSPLPDGRWASSPCPSITPPPPP